MLMIKVPKMPSSKKHKVIQVVPSVEANPWTIECFQSQRLGYEASCVLNAKFLFEAEPMLYYEIRVADDDGPRSNLTVDTNKERRITFHSLPMILRKIKRHSSDLGETWSYNAIQVKYMSAVVNYTL